MSAASTSFAAALGDYLHAQNLGDGQAPELNAFSGGQSNPTYRVTTAQGSYVLRMQPPGPLLPGAHAVDREYRVMKALQATDVPVPQMLAYCSDAAILGTPFYLMEFLDGRVLMDQSLPGMEPQQRAGIYREMNRVICNLHALDHQSLGLGDFGKTGNYLGRQIARWSRQTLASTLPVPDAMQRLMEWLPQNSPGGDETTLVHGDYRLDNLVFHATQPRVIGVLDWELSTLGHPLADFSYQCMSWHIPSTLWRGIADKDLDALGIPLESEYLRMYAEKTGRDAAEHWDFYMAYNLFRMAAILHGVAQRAADGNANAEDAVETGAKAAPLAELGWNMAQRYAAQRK